jgi:hypothetical protein
MGTPTMPIQTACTACSAKLKVKDELMGKSIKCPKCAIVFKVTAEKAPVSAASASASTGKKPPPPPAWEADEDEEVDVKPKAKPKPKVFDDDGKDEDRDDEAPFNELLEQSQLGDDTRKQIKADIGLREQGIWLGQPDPKIMMVRALGKSALALFVITVMSIVLGAVGSSMLGNMGYLAPILAGLFWLVATPVLVLGIPFMDRRKALATAYVITNKRCIVYTASWFGSVTPESFYPDLLQHMRTMQSWIFGADAGDLVFRSVTTITTTHHARGGTSTSVSTTYYGFLGIRNLNEVERRVREAVLVDDDEEDDDDEEEERRRRKKKRDKRRRDDDD